MKGSLSYVARISVARISVARFLVNVFKGADSVAVVALLTQPLDQSKADFHAGRTLTPTEARARTDAYLAERRALRSQP